MPTRATKHPVSHLPGSPTAARGNGFTVGILGGGQLARMTAQAARRLGVPIIVLDADQDSPAGQVTRQIVAPWTDPKALDQLAREIDVLTLENEFVDLAALETLARAGVMVRPAIRTFEIIQDKLRQKRCLAESGLAVPAVAEVERPEDVQGFAARHGWPVVLKTRSQGYDGHGVALARDPGAIPAAWARLGAGRRPLMAEGFVDFARELAVMVVRNARGEIASYPVVETVQRDYVCHLVRAPAAVSLQIAAAAEEIACAAVAAIGGIGVHGVELFLGHDGQVSVNEIAPRPHNSGHYTIDACETSQFENHLRAVLGLPLGSTAMLAGAAVMANLLGTRSGAAPSVHGQHAGRTADRPRSHVHLYGKRQIRPGRKMGHVTALAETLADAEAAALAAASALDL